LHFSCASLCLIPFFVLQLNLSRASLPNSGRRHVQSMRFSAPLTFDDGEQMEIEEIVSIPIATTTTIPTFSESHNVIADEEEN
jgi:hypothetical protein